MDIKTPSQAIKRALWDTQIIIKYINNYYGGSYNDLSY